jgi:DNA-binding MarR family transcriptional regulator/GNAT superfamily N-acetyltransferase
MPASVPDRHVAAVRRFSRFYTRRIGVLGETLLDSPFSLTEARVLYELAHRPEATASTLCAALGLDAGYASRILARFSRNGLVRRRRSIADARQSLVSLTAKGRRAFAPLDRKSHAEAAALLAPLPRAVQQDVVAAMRAIERLVDAPRPPAAEDAPSFTLRDPRPGDMGWVIARHGAIYAAERGWGAAFEALVAGVVADFARSNDPARERCWIAEHDGENVGCVFLVRGSDELAKLRLLLVEPAARGLGLGQRLVAECIAFARESGYREMTLWTHSCLTAARRIYRAAGFTLARSEPHTSFGSEVVGEHWTLRL